MRQEAASAFVLGRDQRQTCHCEFFTSLCCCCSPRCYFELWMKKGLRKRIQRKDWSCWNQGLLRPAMSPTSTNKIKLYSVIQETGKRKLSSDELRSLCHDLKALPACFIRSSICRSGCKNWKTLNMHEGWEQRQRRRTGEQHGWSTLTW